MLSSSLGIMLYWTWLKVGLTGGRKKWGGWWGGENSFANRSKIYLYSLVKHLRLFICEKLVLT